MAEPDGPEFRDRLPGVVVDEQGKQLQKTEGFRPTKLQNVPLEGHELLRNQSGRTPEARASADLALDGVDAEILFPNKGLTIWATPDARFSQAMCRAYNEWAWETFGPVNDQLGAHGLRRHAVTSTAPSPRSSAARRSGSRGCACRASRCSGPQPRGPQLQPARVRAVVGLHRRRRPADHVPRLDRP